MKRLALFTLIFVFVAGIACAKDYEVKKKVGEFEVAVTIDKSPPITGDNKRSPDIEDWSRTSGGYEGCCWGG